MNKNGLDLNLNQVSENERREMPKSNRNITVVLIILVVCLGVFTGYQLSRRGSKVLTSGEISKEQMVKGKEFGAKDTSSFKDTAIGVLEKNGLESEGTHRLIREGGPSQTVFVLSSVLDLDQFIGQKIQVWGETNKAQKAGWLMDIGKIKILE